MPDVKLWENKLMKAARNLVEILIMMLVVGCAMTTGREEGLMSVGGIILSDIKGSAYSREGAWQVALSKEVEGQYSIVEFVPKGETIDRWTRLYMEQNQRRTLTSPSDPEAMMAETKALMEKRCPGVVWKVIRKSDREILYEYYFEKCSGQSGQHEIARILYGQWNIWRLAYIQKGLPMDEQERLMWIEALSVPEIIVR